MKFIKYLDLNSPLGKTLIYLLKVFVIPLLLIVTVMEIAKYRGYVMIHLVCTQQHHQHNEECVDDSQQEISTKVKEKPGEEETI